MHRISCRLLFCLAALCGSLSAVAADALQVRIGYLAYQPPMEHPPELKGQMLIGTDKLHQ